MFLDRMRVTLSRLFYGRCGIDSLNKLLLWVYIIIWFINMFVLRINGRVAVYYVLYFLWLAIFIVFLLRAFSRDIYKRQSENLKYLNIKSKIAGLFKPRPKMNYDKSKVLKRCPNCGAMIRLPKKRGKHTVCCPKCQVDFKVRI